MFKKLLSLIVIVCFFLTTLGPLPKAHADTVLGLPQPGTMVNLSPAYEPALIKGLTVHKDNSFLFDFIVYEVPFINSNEIKYSEILESIRLPKPKRRSSSLYIGVSGMQNLDMIAARFSEFGLLIDINKKTREFFKIISRIFNRNPQINQADFIKVLLEELRKPRLGESNYFGVFSILGDLEYSFKSKGSWLNDKDRFNYIRSMFIEGRIVQIQGNISDKKLFRAIVGWANQNGVSLDTFYISDVFNWKHVTNLADLKTNILAVSNSQTLILDSSSSPALELKIKHREDFAMNGQLPVLVYKPLTDVTKGGIDLNPAQMSMQVKKEGQDFKFNFNGTEIDAAQITGATFTIRTMTPVTNLPQILGLNLEPADTPKQELLAKV